MRAPAKPAASKQAGIALLTSLLLLVVLTILALSMFRSFGVQERIAGNVREKQKALHAAESAQQFAEFWLTSGTNAISAPFPCVALKSANSGETHMCSNRLVNAVDTNVLTVPWTVSGNEVGFSYDPANGTTSDLATATSNGANLFYQLPRFYISDAGVSAAGANKEVYRIDSWSYGGTPGTVSIVESTYEVTYLSKCVSC